MCVCCTVMLLGHGTHPVVPLFWHFFPVILDLKRSNKTCLNKDYTYIHFVQSTNKQCCGSVTFLYGSWSGRLTYGTGYGSCFFVSGWQDYCVPWAACFESAFYFISGSSHYQCHHTKKCKLYLNTQIVHQIEKGTRSIRISCGKVSLCQFGFVDIFWMTSQKKSFQR